MKKYYTESKGNILHTINRRKGNWIGHILRKNYLLKHVIEGKLEGRIEMTGRRGRRRKQLLDDLKEKRRYWKLKEKALDRILWRSRFGRSYGPSVRQTTELMNTIYFKRKINTMYTRTFQETVVFNYVYK
jgi:hypothetical protein